MNAVIYARYSSDSQREESIEGQLRECREYAERNNMTIVGTYIDRALSAKTADRPEFQHMIKDSAKELFEIVLVWKLDRFSRDRYDSAHYKHILKKNSMTCPFFNRSLTFWRVTSTSDTVLFRRSAFSSATHSKAEKSRRRRFVSYSSFPSAAYCSVASWRISALALSSSIGCCFRALSNASCVLGCVAGVELR